MVDLLSRSVIDQFFGLEFEAKTKCAETDAEPETKSVEKFLQFSCYIDKEVKYLSSGLKNVRPADFVEITVLFFASSIYRFPRRAALS